MRVSKGPSPSPSSAMLLRHALRMVKDCGAKALLVYADALGDESQQPPKRFRRKFIVVTRTEQETEAWSRAFPTVLHVPSLGLSRLGQIRAAVLLAVTRQLLKRGDTVIGVAGPSESGELDTLLVVDVSREFGGLFGQRGDGVGWRGIRPEVFERVLSIASLLGAEGREGKPVGALFVVGDTDKVLPLTRQMVLNPFRGHLEGDRNILDPELTETVREFSALDGAFVIDTNGLIVTAGAFLVPSVASDSVPLGLGTRHQAAAAITMVTSCISVTVSQSSGVVTVFRTGKIVTAIETRPHALTKTGAPPPGPEHRRQT